MGIKKVLYCIITLLLVTLTCVSAQEVLNSNHMKLLAVSELPNGSHIGSDADLTIEVVPGSGRVFLDTYPLTKIDTQVSTRIAKEIACNFLQADCSEYDFIYTISSGSSIIGGPSAGAAIAAITIATLTGTPIDDTVALTGTINSGGIVGQVAGIKEKIEAAKDIGLETVMIPNGELFIQEEITNDTDVTINTTDENNTQNISYTNISIVQYGEEIGIRVVPVGTLYDVLSELTHTNYSQQITNIHPPNYYNETMQDVAQSLCARAESFYYSIFLDNYVVNNETTVTIQNQTITIHHTNTSLQFTNSSISVNATFHAIGNLLNQSQYAYNNSEYYSAASYCYGASLNAHFLQSLNQDVTEIWNITNATFEQFSLDLSHYKTLHDLQIYMLVDERIQEAQENKEQAEELYREGRYIDAQNLFITALERLNSAQSWSTFFKNYGEQITLDSQTLQDACEIRIQEAEQRRNYLEIYVPLSTSLLTDLEKAKEYQDEYKYELCLFQASKAKASIDIVLSTLGVIDNNITQLLEDRKLVVYQTLQSQLSKNVFPVVGYSYYEYANSLSDSDPFSSLRYYHYALELANLDVYFPKKELTLLPNNLFDIPKTQVYILGIATGIIASVILIRIERWYLRLHHKRKHKK